MMDIKAVKKFLEENRDSEEVKALFPQPEPKKLGLEDIKGLLEDDESLSSWLDGIKSAHAERSLEEWRKANLDELVEAEIEKRMTPEDRENNAIKALEDKVKQMEAEKNYELQKNLALKTAQEKGIPVGLIDFFIGEDNEKTLENLSVLEDNFTKGLEEAVKVRLKDDTYVPPKNKRKIGGSASIEDMSDWSPEEINDFFENK